MLPAKQRIASTVFFVISIAIVVVVVVRLYPSLLKTLITMADTSTGIQELMAAETRASQIVAEARIGKICDVKSGPWAVINSSIVSDKTRRGVCSATPCFCSCCYPTVGAVHNNHYVYLT